MHTARLCVLLAAAWLSCAPVGADGSAADSAPPEAFPRPESLAPAVAFWTRVYTEVDTSSGFVHDDRALSVVYQVLHLNPYVAPAVQDKTIERTIAGYQRALLALADGKRSELSKTERRALRPWGKNATAAALRAAAERVRFQRGQSNRFKKGLVRAAKWQVRIVKILRDQGLPPELAALPHLESSYNPEARSRAGAAGLWQLMPATAQRYLRVDDEVDERLDPYKSTEAAARLLQHNHAVLESWPLALAAYNHGLSGIWRAVQETGTRDIGEIVTRYAGDRFGFASRNFYPAFLAALDVSRNATRYFGDDLGTSRPDPIVVTVPAYLPVEVLTEAFDIDRGYLRDLNPSLLGTVWADDKFVPKDFRLRLPGYLAAPAAQSTLLELARTAGYISQKPDVYYEVQAGESLSVIAEKLGKSVLELMAMNRMRDPHWIRAGHKLLVATGPAPERLSTRAGALAKLEGGPEEPPPKTPLTAAEAADGGAAAPTQAREPRAEQAQAEQAQPVPPRQSPAAQAAETRAGPAAADESRLPVESQPALAADPADYTVAADGTIRIQTSETLGHYADWLGVKSSRLEELNGLKEGASLVVGHRLKLDFSQVDPAGFEQRRIAYHESLQAEYFRHFHIKGIREHRIKDGDNLWILATREYDIPLWLLRQYNPDIGFDTVLPQGEIIAIPLVQG
jgi:membrane-bound lytic murein transglycosylase D